MDCSVTLRNIEAAEKAAEPWTVDRLARLLDAVSKPTDREDVPIEFDPDEVF